MRAANSAGVLPIGSKPTRRHCNNWIAFAAGQALGRGNARSTASNQLLLDFQPVRRIDVETPRRIPQFRRPFANQKAETRTGSHARRKR
jgi:hypothetical protein